ncbi:MAG TPA: FAD-dependent oxidoreductase [Candidatus Limnocylindria bacterium]|nr:FAD-dependent oxidoreductase [Candidatus Limnocylindria bacterium]
MAAPSRSRPTILVVDDDAPVLRAVERDLRARYGNEYRIVAAGGGEEAVEAIRQLTVRGSAVALLVADQRMPRMTGIEVLLASLELQPDAKRVLLTAYADTEVAIRAINEVRLDQYILKPWDPPEEKLFPVLDDLLADWSATFRPAFEGLRLLAGRWAPRGHAIRDFLTRNGIPYAWLDPEADDEGRRLAAAQPEAPDPAVPVVLLPDGTALRDPSSREIGERVGLSTHARLPFYDLAIIGGGPAGLAAAVYGASEGLKTVLIEREAPGGQAGTTSRIENYLGFPAGLSGGDLARRALTQARRLGAEILTPTDVRALRREDPYRIVTLEEGELSCQALVIATGVSYRTLDLEGADRLAGAGIYYGAASSEAVLYRDAEVGVVGGGNSAGQAVVYLSRFARTVHLIVRGGSLGSMSQYLIEQIEALPNVEVRTESAVTAVRGEQHLEGATLKGPGGEEEREVTALFVFIGQQPRTEWLADTLLRDEPGFILAGPATLTDGRPPAGWSLAREPFLLETSMPGVFAAGDVRHRSVKRIASAVGEGAMAVQFVHQYLAGL